MSDGNLSTIDATIETLDLDLPEGAREKLDQYLSLLLQANQRFNLTSITDRDEAESRLIAESLALLPLIPEDTRAMIDVGTGGGIPGFPIAIARPEMRVDLLDSTRKKVNFLHEAVKQLGLEHAVTIAARAEDHAKTQGVREQYDVAVARAVARLASLVELTLPFVRVGGLVILPKGEALEDELADAERAITVLGGAVQTIHESPINATRMIVIEKRHASPPSYPRRAGIPQKQPIHVPSR